MREEKERKKESKGEYVRVHGSAGVCVCLLLHSVLMKLLYIRNATESIFIACNKYNVDNERYTQPVEYIFGYG